MSVVGGRNEGGGSAGGAIDLLHRAAGAFYSAIQIRGGASRVKMCAEIECWYRLKAGLRHMSVV